MSRIGPSQATPAALPIGLSADVRALVDDDDLHPDALLRGAAPTRP